MIYRSFLVLLFTVMSAPLFGQMINRIIPSDVYFTFSLRYFNEGLFDKALAEFSRDVQRAVKIPDANGRMFLWLDSMTYWIMCGECHYQEARYDEALQAFETAAQIYLQQPDWLKQITYSGSPQTVPRQPFPWGASARKGGTGNFSQCKFQILQENINIINLGKQGVAFQQNAQLTAIRADEIISKMALMIRRRAEILGPLSKYDPTTKNLAEILGAKPCLPNHFTGVWVDVLYGLALSAMDDDAAAAPELERGLLMQGQFDHQLTPVALYELGNIARRANKNEDAQKYYMEASYSAFFARDWALVGECFRKAADMQKLIDKAQPFLPLAAALTYFGSQKDVSPLVLVPLCHERAEDLYNTGDAAGAALLNQQASNLMKGRSIAGTVHGARNFYLAALLSYTGAYADYAAGKPPQLKLQAGDKNLETALGFMRRGSLWLYRLRVLENFFQRGMITTRGPITIRIADELYDLLLQDPSAIDWATQPMDSLAAMTFIPPEAFERWFNVALQRGDKEKAFNISEKARRAKFFSSFSLGPRLFSLRLLFEGSVKDNPELKLERQTMTLDFARFSELSNKVKDIKQQLQQIPLIPKEQTDFDRQKLLFQELERYSFAQEAMLRPMALTRTSAPNVFPPVLTLEQIRKGLPENTAMLVFVPSQGTYYVFMLDRRNLDMWTLTQETKGDSVSKLITDYLDALGNKDANRAMTGKDLSDPKAKWKEAGKTLLTRLLGNKPRPVNFTELVIVPSGPLWYVPFEAMCVGNGDALRPLITAGDNPLRIRYAPTASLGVPLNTGGRSATASTLVVCGKLMSKDASEVAFNAVDRFGKAGVQNLIPMPMVPSDANYRDLPGSSSAFASQVQQLVVLDDIPQSDVPMGWTPFSGDKAKLKNPVSTWFTLPWGGPQLVVLPGFHTPAESSLKTVGRSVSKSVPNGDDLFLTAMLLEACGAKTVLLSRWRTGGRASYDLTEEFLKNYAKMPAAEAWQEAILDVGSEPLKGEEEPRVRISEGERMPMANHPFFWGSFMLIDRGEKPESGE